jgi:hypothetical protein
MASGYFVKKGQFLPILKENGKSGKWKPAGFGQIGPWFAPHRLATGFAGLPEEAKAR